MWGVQKTHNLTKEYTYRVRTLIWPFYFNLDLCAASGLPADNLILKPFQTELSQRALFLVKLFLVVLVLLLLVVNCLEFENVTFKLSFHYDRWILERKWSGKMPMRRHLNFIVKREEKFPMENIEKMRGRHNVCWVWNFPAAGMTQHSAYTPSPSPQ